ncbi:MAG: DUF6503 family protein [Salibacteraceae bacterium]
MINLGFKSWVVLIQLSFFVGFVSCSSNQDADNNTVSTIDSANWVIDQSVAAHGVLPKKYSLSFDFRDKLYKGVINEGNYALTREFSTGDSTIRDLLTNDSFMRSINGDSVLVSEERIQAYSNSINSVFYFTLLPWKLKDPAVNAEFLGINKNKSGNHYTIKVSFNQEGGGDDFEDQFMYWFNTETHLLDFFAYSYNTNGGGVRFRSVEYRHNTSAGHILQDYVNYKHEDLAVDLTTLLDLFNNQALTELSKIRLRNVALISGKEKD